MKVIRDRENFKMVKSVVSQSKNQISQVSSYIGKNLSSMDNEEEEQQKHSETPTPSTKTLSSFHSLRKHSFSILQNRKIEEETSSSKLHDVILETEKEPQKISHIRKIKLQKTVKKFSEEQPKDNFVIPQNNIQKTGKKIQKEQLKILKNKLQKLAKEREKDGSKICEKNLQDSVPIQVRQKNFSQRRWNIASDSIKKTSSQENKHFIQNNPKQSQSISSKKKQNIPQSWIRTKTHTLGVTEKDFLSKTQTQIKNIGVKALTKGQSIVLNSSSITIGSNSSSMVASKTMATSGVATGGTSTAMATSGFFLKKTVEGIKKMKEKFVESTDSSTPKKTQKNIISILTEKKKDTQEKEKVLLPLMFSFFFLTFPMYLFLLFCGITTNSQDLVSGNGGTIIEVAQKEADEVNIGGTKYKTWYGMNDNWCAMFVSWCAEQCGYLEAGIMPKAASVSVMQNWYISKNRYQTKESGYEPNPGDIIIFKNGRSHVGIVKEYDSETKIITTLEGNTGSSGGVRPYHAGSRVKQCTYPLSNQTISGYGIPDYPEETNSIIVDNIEEMENAN